MRKQHAASSIQCEHALKLATIRVDTIREEGERLPEEVLLNLLVALHTESRKRGRAGQPQQYACFMHAS
eukprot:SAG11_NODE_4250_length_1986_cov_1.946476_3_plen_69_part_00